MANNMNQPLLPKQIIFQEGNNWLAAAIGGGAAGVHITTDLANDANNVWVVFKDAGHTGTFLAGAAKPAGGKIAVGANNEKQFIIDMVKWICEPGDDAIAARNNRVLTCSNSAAAGSKVLPKISEIAPTAIGLAWNLT